MQVPLCLIDDSAKAYIIISHLYKGFGLKDHSYSQKQKNLHNIPVNDNYEYLT